MTNAGKERRLRFVAGALAAVFAAVGFLFLLAPEGIIRFFNRLSEPLGFAPAPAAAASLFLALAVAYMAVVTVLAARLARKPRDAASARLLVLAKLASALVSFGLFAARSPHLILLANGAVDGLIGAGVLALYGRGVGADPGTRPGRDA